MLKKYFSSPLWIVLLIILVVELLFNLILKSYVLNDKVLFNSLVEQMTLEDINTLVSSFKSNSIALILLSLLQPLIEILMITVCLNVGTLLLNIPVGFKPLGSIVSRAYVVFSIARIISILMIVYFGVARFEDLTYIPQLSLADWVGPASIPTWALYPMQLINVYQALFVLLLITGFNVLYPGHPRRWTGLVLASYGAGLVILILIVGFLTAL